MELFQFLNKLFYVKPPTCFQTAKREFYLIPCIREHIIKDHFPVIWTGGKFLYTIHVSGYAESPMIQLHIASYSGSIVNSVLGIFLACKFLLILELEKTLASWTEPGHLHSMYIWISQYYHKVPELWTRKTGYSYRNQSFSIALLIYIWVPSIHPNACNKPSFNSNFETTFLMSFSFLGKKRYSGPTTLFMASHTLIKVFDTVRSCKPKY